MRKDSALTQRPIVAVASLVGAALAGAAVAGLGLDLASGETTRAGVRAAYSNAMEDVSTRRPDDSLSARVPQSEDESASMLGGSADTGDLKLDLMPPFPTLAPAADPTADSPPPSVLSY